MIKREMYMQKIRPFIGTDLIKVLTGIRRGGKSVMLELIKQELIERGEKGSQFISINFEDFDNAPLRNAQALHDFIGKKIKRKSTKTYIFLDEIQEADGWQKCVNSLRSKFDVDIYITGSNSNLLSGELATYLAGRYADFVVYPFSFREFMLLHTEPRLRRGNLTGSINPQDVFQKYVMFGGMPFLENLNFTPQPCRQYLRDIYNSVVLKDIVNRHSIRDVDLLERIIIYVMANVGRTFSATSIAKYFKSEHRKVATETILNYIKACESAFLFFRAKRHDLVGKKILTVNEKFFTADHGLREAIYGKNQGDIELVLENIVYLELLRRGFSVTVGKVGDKEVDFVAQRDDERLYVQVCYVLTDGNREREFSPLEAIGDNYQKLVLSTDTLFKLNLNGIKHKNIVEFLIEG